MPKKRPEKTDLLRTVPQEGDSPVKSHKSGCFAVLVLVLATFLFLCLVSYDPRDPSFNVATQRTHVSNLCGLLGSHISDALVQLLGVGAFLLPLSLGLYSITLLWAGSVALSLADIGFSFLLLAGVSCLMDRFSFGAFLSFPLDHPAGALGSFFHSVLGKFLGSGGELLFSCTFMFFSLLHFAKVSPGRAVRVFRSPAAMLSDMLKGSWNRCKELFAEARQMRIPFPAVRSADNRVNELPGESARTVGSESPSPKPKEQWAKISLKIENTEELLTDDDMDEEPCVEPPCQKSNGKSGTWKALNPLESRAPVSQTDMEEAIDEYLSEIQKKVQPKPRVAEKRPEPEAIKVVESELPRPIKVIPRADEALPVTATPVVDETGDYVLPHSDLLDTPPASARAVDEKLLEENASVLEQKLANLGVRGQVVEIHPGPVITMYELSLEPGIPLRRVLNMADDLAMALKSGSTRIVAPIPGKDTVGIEVPNLNREIVYFREIIESPAFSQSNAPLKLALGKQIDGEPFATSLARMPHLLIAGATGTGKSVGLNCLICSWLMSCHPDDVKFIMVDPKRLELSYYNDIPHLLHPVVTEAEKVPKVLSWAIKEMERRYELLSLSGSKNIESFNDKVRLGELPPDVDDNPERKLPYIVIIVDELAELMMVAAKDIEISIARLAQMARASGIHLILATQRPSVDVITGVIKANFPARLSFQVSAKPDSRTILDTVGAENLLGMGDMLFLPPGTAKITRLHGAFLSEKEIRRIVDFIKAQRSPTYLQEICKHVSDGESGMVQAELIDDEKYDEAVQLVTRLGHASISLIQRHMRIGYNRAARIIEAMESEGIIGPSDGTSRPREVLARSLESVPDR